MAATQPMPNAVMAANEIRCLRSASSAARNRERIAGQGRKPGECDLSGGVGEQQACHQDLAGEVVVTGASGAQDEADHDQVGGELCLIGQRHDGQRRASPQHRRRSRHHTGADARRSVEGAP